MAFALPGGPKKGTPLSEASDTDLRWWFEKIAKDITADPGKKFADKDRQWLAAAKTELVKRGHSPDDLVMPAAGGNGGASNGQQQGHPIAARPQQSAALARDQPQQIVAGTFSNAAAASQALIAAGREYHLIAPAVVVGRLPEGCEVVVSVVQIDPTGVEVYNITGDKNNPKDDDTVGLDKIALAKIGKAAGVTWLYSRRTDDGSHPHYCAWEAKARARNFDMTYSDYPGNVDIDTREDGDVRGAAAEEIRSKGASRADKGAGQLLELRKFLLRHCESKAMNKALGNFGIRRSYKRKDLKKPFAVAKLSFTGYSEDPEARKEFRQMIGQSFLQAAGAAYGAAPPPAVNVLPPLPQYQLPPTPHAPPPIGVSLDQGYGAEDFDTGEIVEQPASAKTPSTPGDKPATAPEQEQLKT